MAKKKSIAPMNATFDQLCDLPRDCKNWGDWRLSTDSYRVNIAKQAMGENPTQEVEIPRHIFNRLIRWYTATES